LSNSGRLTVRLFGASMQDEKSGDAGEKEYPSKQDVARLRQEVIEGFPEASPLFQSIWCEGYIKEVMNSKCSSGGDGKARRTFKNSVEKFKKAFKYRIKYNVDEIYTHKKESTKIEIPHSVKNASTCGSLYWKDFDKEHRPILWVMNSRKDWWNLDLDQQRQFHIWMIEYGINNFPPKQTQFVVIANTSNMTMLQATRMRYMKMLIEIFMTLYPCRVKYLLVGPVSTLLRKLSEAFTSHFS